MAGSPHPNEIQSATPSAAERSMISEVLRSVTRRGGDGGGTRVEPLLGMNCGKDEGRRSGLIKTVCLCCWFTFTAGQHQSQRATHHCSCSFVAVDNNRFLEILFSSVSGNLAKGYFPSGCCLDVTPLQPSQPQSQNTAWRERYSIIPSTKSLCLIFVDDASKL